MLKHTEAETDSDGNEEVGQIPEVLRTDVHTGSPAATSPSESPATVGSAMPVSLPMLHLYRFTTKPIHVHGATLVRGGSFH